MEAKNQNYIIIQNDPEIFTRKMEYEFAKNDINHKEMGR